jgi:sacsin
VDESLAEYQGPALMVYNNSKFSETDFHSLKSLGDSQKVSNKLSTGKFGLGFSSVHVILLIELMVGLWMD